MLLRDPDVGHNQGGDFYKDFDEPLETIVSYKEFATSTKEKDTRMKFPKMEFN